MKWMLNFQMTTQFIFVNKGKGWLAPVSDYEELNSMIDTLIKSGEAIKTSTAIINDNTNKDENNKSENNQQNGNSVSVPNKNEQVENGVWVPTQGGTKYHSKSSCSNMVDPIQVSLETAKKNGYTPCGRCH